MKVISLLLITILSSLSFSQSISNEVIGSAGEEFSDGSVDLSWTLGEIMTETYSASGTLLTQGFHQPYINQSTTGIRTINEQLTASVFPNPTNSNATLIINNSTESFYLELYDISGKIVFSDDHFFDVPYLIDLSWMQDA